MLLPEEAELFAESAHGVYIPQHFAKAVNRDLVTGVTEDDWRILEAGPEHELYWEAWNDVESRAVVHAPEGVDYYLYQDGDLWLVPKEIDRKANVSRLLEAMRIDDIYELAAEKLVENPGEFEYYWGSIDG